VASEVLTIRAETRGIWWDVWEEKVGKGKWDFLDEMGKMGRM
jgi:hypothetical protein